jgi:hypothetical protein
MAACLDGQTRPTSESERAQRMRYQDTQYSTRSVAEHAPTHGHMHRGSAHSHKHMRLPAPAPPEDSSPASMTFRNRIATRPPPWPPGQPVPRVNGCTSRYPSLPISESLMSESSESSGPKASGPSHPMSESSCIRVIRYPSHPMSESSGIRVIRYLRQRRRPSRSAPAP